MILKKNEFIVQSAWLGKKKLLTLTPEYLSVNMVNEPGPGIHINKEDIEGYRYGARRARYYLYLYTYYNIDVKCSDHVIKIRLLSLFGINNKQISDRYVSILDTLYACYFREMVHSYLNLFDHDIDFEISGLIFTSKGIIYSKKEPILAWADVQTRDYISYYAIFSKSDNYYYKMFHYKDDWNSAIIYSVSRTILSNMGLWTDEE